MNGRLLSLVIFLLILAGLITRNGLVLALSLLYVLYFSAGLFGLPEDIRLDVNRTLSVERIGSDLPVVVTMTVRNTGHSLEEVLVEDGLPSGLTVIDGSARHLLRLPAGKEVTWTYTIRGRRGYFVFSSVKVKVLQPLGLVSRQQNFYIPANLFILPPVLRLRKAAIRPRRTRVYSGIVPARTGGPGVEFFDLREYQAGDPPRWINWQASARHFSTLFSKEFEQERVADVGIILDGRMRANLIAQDHSIFEYSASAAATLAEEFLDQGNRVSLLIYGEYVQWTLPGYGKRQRERILRNLARAQLGHSQIFSNLDHIPTRLFPARSQVVIISPLTPDDPQVLLTLRARGYRVLLITPDPVAFEVSNLPRRREFQLAARIVSLERDLMIQRLQRAGIQLVNWDVSQPFDQAMNRGLGRLPIWSQSLGGSR